jgi:ABC-type transport system involved in multi-copper enzyme maturation permease subunit
MKSIAIMLKLTIREAIRRKVLWGLLLLSAAFLVLYTLGLTFVHNGMRLPRNAPFKASDVYNFLLIAGLYAANFLIVMLTVLISVDTLAGEINSGTIQAIAVKPLRRRDILLGKWIGFVIMLAVCVLLLAGGTLLITLIVTGYTPPNWLGGIGLMLLEALTLLSVSLVGGTRLSTLANGVLGFGLFGVAFIGSWIEQVGQFVNIGGATSVGHFAAFLMPAQAVWQVALSQMAEGFNPFKMMFTFSAPPDANMTVYAIGYAAILLLLAMRSFQRRDL